jgi:hypothetical protein
MESFKEAKVEEVELIVLCSDCFRSKSIRKGDFRVVMVRNPLEVYHNGANREAVM